MNISLVHQRLIATTLLMVGLLVALGRLPLLPWGTAERQLSDLTVHCTVARCDRNRSIHRGIAAQAAVW